MQKVSLILLLFGAVVIAATMIRGQVFGHQIASGDTARLPENMLVKVVNPEPISSNKGDFGFGDQCLALEGDTVTAVATADDRVLLRHEKPREFFYGVCPKGIYFFSERSAFLTMTDRYVENVKKNKAEMELVKSLLQKIEIQPPSP